MIGPSVILTSIKDFYEKIIHLLYPRKKLLEKLNLFVFYPFFCNVKYFY